MELKKAELSKKLIELEELPTQEECVTLLEILESEQRRGWRKFCTKHEMWQVVHKELVDRIHEILSGLNPSCLVEVCSGTGKLAYWLNKRGLDVRATDNYTFIFNSGAITHIDFVEKLNHKEALQKYNPDVVLLCWPPENSSIPIDIIDYPSVRYLLHLGNAEYFKWRKEMEKRPNVRIRDLNINDYTYPIYAADRRMENSLYEDQLSSLLWLCTQSITCLPQSQPRVDAQFFFLYNKLRGKTRSSEST